MRRGAVLGTPKTLSAAQAAGGTIFVIPQSQGILSGPNLFFSFRYFNLGTGQTALYTTTSPRIDNLITRVTGGAASTIDGTISVQAAYGAPNFFFNASARSSERLMT